MDNTTKRVVRPGKQTNKQTNCHRASNSNITISTFRWLSHVQTYAHGVFTLENFSVGYVFITRIIFYLKKLLILRVSFNTYYNSVNETFISYTLKRLPVICRAGAEGE